MILRTPPGFDLQRTLLSHGWAYLPPFRLDTGSTSLSRDGWEVSLRADGAVELRGRAGKSEVERVLNLACDLGNFYALCRNPPGRGEPDLRWVPGSGAGRLLRCPTVFEDLVKMVCTTNCSWALTEKMVGGLVELGGGRFPSPATIAEAGPSGLREMSFGYRARPVAEIACAVSEGELDPEAWLDPAASGESVRASIRGLPGCGPYVADNVAKLCGHYDGLGLDSWVRTKLARMTGRKLSDRQIAWRYRKFGAWRGLALWCDLTADWIENGEAKKDW